MSHYAKIINNIVTDVIYCEDSFINDLIDKDSWIQTSVNTYGGKHYDYYTKEIDDKPAFRKNYAGIGFTYDVKRDAFIPPKPYNSWILNEETCLWDPPIPRPNDFINQYDWDEESQQWIKY